VRNDGWRLDPPAFSGRSVIAKSSPPYMDWVTQELDQRVQGFAFYPLPDGYSLPGYCCGRG
jgi:hypothetical protein